MNDNLIFKLPEDSRQTRWFTFENRNGEKGKGGMSFYGRKGSASTQIKAGGKLELMNYTGSGTVRRMWATVLPLDNTALRGLVLEMFWDGAESPAVRAPFGDFFCHIDGLKTFENALFCSPEGRSFVCTIPMPFKKSSRIVLTNESPVDIVLYYEIDITAGDKHDENTLYFHSSWNRENMTTIRKDFTILPYVEGKGRFLGCNIGIRVNQKMDNFWWGEGEFKAYIDGDNEFPTLCGTGFEDYLGTGWEQNNFINKYSGSFGPNLNELSELYSGSYGRRKYSMYRFHIKDPIYFYENCRITIQNMGSVVLGKLIESVDKYKDVEFGKVGPSVEYYTREELVELKDKGALIERRDDMCATAYWYMNSVSNTSAAKALPPYEDRIKDITIKI